VRYEGSAAADLPPFAGQPVVHAAGPPRLELRVDRGPPLEITDVVALVR
jgi:hypothetical protein